VKLNDLPRLGREKVMSIPEAMAETTGKPRRGAEGGGMA